MKNVFSFASILAVFFALLGGVSRSVAQAPQSVQRLSSLGSAFTYQGHLVKDGQAVSGSCEMAFSLYDASMGGSLVGGPLSQAVTVSNGLFLVILDFGAGVFDGSPRWLGAEVKCAGDTAATALARQAIRPVPYALTAGTALNAEMLDGQHAGYFQARVTGACAVGSTIRAIQADGTVICQPDALINRAIPPAANTIATLDSDGVVGWSSSMTIGADGRGLISYWDETNYDLKVAHCNDAACSSATTITLDGGGGANVGTDTSVTIGADGLGLISYFDATNIDLKVAHCNDIACSSATTATLDGGDSANVGEYTSVTIGADGLGLISYSDGSNDNLKVAHCKDIACSSADFRTFLSGGVDGWYTSMTTGADGLWLISYYDESNSALKVAHCNDIACSVATTATLDGGGAGYYPSVTIGADRLGLISYFDVTKGDLKVAHCNDAACSSATLATLDSDGVVGNFTSATIGANGLGLISYYDVTNGDLKVAHCKDILCSSADISTLDSDGDVGRYTSVTIGADGLGLVSYFDATNGDLKVLHCANALCTPYFRRR